MHRNYTYTAFGKLEGRSGNTENSYRFAGEQFDEQFDNYYLRERFYSPDLGRFIRRDSFEGYPSDPPSLHRYGYTHNNPVNLIDPSGFSAFAEFNLNSIANASLVEKILVTGLVVAGGVALGLGTYVAIDAFVNLYVPIFYNKEYVPPVPDKEALDGKTDRELNQEADEIAGKTLQNARKDAKANSGEGKSGRSGQNAGAKMNAGNGLIQAANDLPGNHPLREKLKTRGKRYIQQAKADNHPG